MTPRRYFATVAQAEAPQDEITAIRAALEAAQERERILVLRIDALKEENAQSDRLIEHLAELVRQRDEVIASFNDLKP